MPINRIIKILIASDFLILSGFGFLNPIFAIFITNQIAGAGIHTAGLAATIYLLVKSSLMLPIGKYLDKDQKDKDDFWALIIGCILISIVPFFYIFSSLPWHIYLLQAIYGLGAAICFPPWLALFTRYVDRFREGFEWSIHQAVSGLGAAAAAAIGGFLAEKFGFNLVFVLVSVVSLSGSLLLLLLYKKLTWH